MKFVGIAGSNAEQSYNRQLIQYVQKAFPSLFELDVIDIKDVPMFSTSDDQTNTPFIQDVARRIQEADGIIIATPEHNFTIPPALKSLIEYMTYKVHPLEGKPVLIMGASYFTQGTSRAQLHLRQILEAPGSGAYVFPGNEFLLSNAKQAFDEQGNLKDQGTHNFLRSVLEKFMSFAKLINHSLDEGYAMEEDATSGASESEKGLGESVSEDLWSTEPVDTTIEGIAMTADDWVEQASEMTKAAKGSDYVKLNHGVLTVDQLNNLLKTVPYEVTYADENNQFIYYNYRADSSDMLGPREPEQVGSPLGDVHPDHTFDNVSWVINELRSGRQDTVRLQVPGEPGQFKVHNYIAMRDEEGNYRGIHEMIMDLQPWIDWYFEETGGKVVTKEDANTSASQAEEPVDAATSASQADEESKDDAVTSATSKAATEAEDLWATGTVATTVTDVAKDDPNWVEKVAELTNAASGDDYVELDRGVLTVNQINWLLEALPYEATYADENNQFIYYNYTKEQKEMLGGRQPWQVGMSLAEVHPQRAFAGAAWVVHQLRNGRPFFRVRIPGEPGQFKVHHYIRMEHADGSYAGIHEAIFDLQPWIDWYLDEVAKQHDATSGASDATTSASYSTDATGGASEVWEGQEETNDQSAHTCTCDSCGSGDLVDRKVHVPGNEGEYLVQHFVGTKDANGNYKALQENKFDLQPWIDWYLEETGQRLTKK